MTLQFDDGWELLTSLWVAGAFQNYSCNSPVERRWFTTQEMVESYTLCYKLSTQRNPYNYSDRLYRRYKQSLREFCTAHFLPGFQLSLAHDETLLEELVARLAQMRSLVVEYRRPFHYLERYYIPANRAQTLEQVGNSVFRDTVCVQLKGRILEALANVIRRQREEPQKRPLVCKVLALLDEIGFDVMEDPERTLGRVEESLGTTTIEKLRKEGKEESQAPSWPEEKCNRALLPLAPSQGAFLQRYLTEKLRVLIEPPPPVAAMSAHESEDPRSHDMPPPTKARCLSRGSSPSPQWQPQGTAEQQQMVVAGPRVVISQNVSLEGDVLHQAVVGMNDHMFRELMEYLYIPNPRGAIRLSSSSNNRR